MDTSKEYINMCEKAEKIQNKWEPKEGDFWACPCDACVNRKAKANIVNDYDVDALNKRDLTNLEEQYIKMVRLYGREFVDHFNEVRGTFAWLPRQDQLQEMWHRGIELPYAFQNTFNNWCKKNFPYADKFTSMEQLWLAFVMKEKYNKIWNGKECRWN